MLKSHRFCKLSLGMRLSPFLHEKLVLLGSDEVFGHVQWLAESLLGVCVSESSIYRSCRPRPPCRKVFVTDGAPWIGNWLSGSYPGAVQILDFFHPGSIYQMPSKNFMRGSIWRSGRWSNSDSEMGGWSRHSVRDCDGIAEKMRLSLLGYLANNR